MELDYDLFKFDYRRKVVARLMFPIFLVLIYIDVKCRTASDLNFAQKKALQDVKDSYLNVIFKILKHCYVDR